uniref:Uncharacterized protein n=1 Tax=Entomoneis paludosa TaxID=265537 RepID=A0A7S2YS74_9STRA|mmetsp:Transcript_786/g.1884  ORF Transcript_786/g.1884 Transcript_786/m.1884 type:complete len:221 (+) Transcript_786:206-868(+)|eukprot:CAMPEP_0172470446 /NCGR_PEP_ID=MMETSP1065-20121228/66367_1 /TAXON_ID=265537 /ORGANISM="Amphiprora paludosa, Strain CCMP125" /LENGTH=220 /DNA_ID=CAMNT_0013228377 /DNA_START=191 /DNA_END=853 /DNA_ORIENTATION=-
MAWVPVDEPPLPQTGAPCTASAWSCIQEIIDPKPIHLPELHVDNSNDGTNSIMESSSPPRSSSSPSQLKPSWGCMQEVLDPSPDPDWSDPPPASHVDNKDGTNSILVSPPRSSSSAAQMKPTWGGCMQEILDPSPDPDWAPGPTMRTSAGSSDTKNLVQERMRIVDEYQLIYNIPRQDEDGHSSGSSSPSPSRGTPPRETSSKKGRKKRFGGFLRRKKKG